MARWVILRHGNTTSVFYDNLVSRKRYPLGQLDGDIPDSYVVDWIFNHGGPAYGDRVFLSDGSSFVFQAADAAA